MKKSVKYILISALLAAAVTACRKDDPAEVGETISFRAEASDADNVAATKATKTVASNLTDNPFGVYGVYSDTKGGASGTNVFDNSSALKVTYNTSSSNWEYTRTGDKPKYYWKRNQYYRFRAYHPYTASVEAGGSDADKILIIYRIIQDQYDLLVAFSTRHPATDSEGTERVPMNFQHALSALRFRVAFDKSVDEGMTDVLTEFHICGVQSAGMLNYTHNGDYLTPVINWTSDAFDSTTEFYQSTTQRTFGVYNPDGKSSVDPVDIYGTGDTDNVVFAIPQTCSDLQYGDTSIHFKTVGGGDVDNTAVLPTLTWEPGKIYTYTLLIKKSSVQVVVSIKDWNEVQSTVDINI
jgi:hypothetical protein